MTCIYASRSDGLGQRLNAILNGLIISDLLSIEFKFCWPSNYTSGAQFQSVPKARELFSNDFITSHLVAPTAVPHGAALRFLGGSVEAVKASLREQIANGAFIVSPRELLWKIDEENVRNEIIHKIRKKLEFTSVLQDALDAVVRLRGGGRFVAIHVRAGDIIYGKFSEKPYFYLKVIPTPIVLCLIQSLKSNGAEVALFGQETEFIDSVTRDYGLFVPPDFIFADPETPLSLAFQDICGMGMAEKIVSGSSGFSRFSSQYFCIPMTVPSAVMPKKVLLNKMVDLIFDSAFASVYFSPEQRAYGLFYAFQSARKFSSYELLSSFIEGALLLMPDNKMYQLWDVLNKIRFGELNAADEKFSKIFLEMNLESLEEYGESRLAKLLILNKLGGQGVAYEEYSLHIKNGADKSLACGVLLVFVEKKGSPFLQQDLEVLKVWHEKCRSMFLGDVNLR